MSEATGTGTEKGTDSPGQKGETGQPTDAQLAEMSQQELLALGGKLDGVEIVGLDRERRRPVQRVAVGHGMDREATAGGADEWSRSKGALARFYAAQVLTQAPGLAEGLMTGSGDLEAVSFEALAS